MNVQKFLTEKIHKAMINAGISKNFTPNLCRTERNFFGHYQINGIFSIAKNMKISPIILAKKIIKFLNFNNIANKLEIIHPGFINIYLKTSWIEKILLKMFLCPNFDIKKTKNPKNIVIDYSSPNIAKEMHIGHLRSTILGDTISKILEFLGHNIIRVNHIGDWGMQFGILIAWFKKNKINLNILNLQKIECCYKEAKKLYIKNFKFAENARNYLVKLQNNDNKCLKIWKKLVNITIENNQRIYNRLNISLNKENIMGESTYNNLLPSIILELEKKGLVINHEGAKVVFLKIFKNKIGNSMGVIVQKKDGGYLYSTIDIACIKYRFEILHADRILYFTDFRQKQHLMQVWEIAKKAGYVPKKAILEHYTFGMILNEHEKPFKTRSGKTIKLSSLLNFAIYKASKLIYKKNPLVSKIKLKYLSESIGISAIKYFDLSKNRNTNYVFKWKNILNFEGNTSLYIQYTYVRISSLLRKNFSTISLYNKKIKITLNKKEDIKLAIKLIQFEEIFLSAIKKISPHIICLYLYNLSVIFSHFYECCNILQEKDNCIRDTRLQLTILTGKIIKFGLKILGINIIDKI